MRVNELIERLEREVDPIYDPVVRVVKVNNSSRPKEIVNVALDGNGYMYIDVQ